MRACIPQTAGLNDAFKLGFTQDPSEVWLQKPTKTDICPKAVYFQDNFAGVCVCVCVCKFVCLWAPEACKVAFLTQSHTGGSRRRIFATSDTVSHVNRNCEDGVCQKSEPETHSCYCMLNPRTRTCTHKPVWRIPREIRCYEIWGHFKVQQRLNSCSLTKYTSYIWKYSLGPAECCWIANAKSCTVLAQYTDTQKKT